MVAKPRFPRAVGLAVARELVKALQPVCERLVVAGSLRRGRSDIGDVEILYIGRSEERPVPGDLFARRMADLAELRVADLEASGILARRPNVNGGTAYGPKNKLMLHVASGLPVDLFSATPANWFNYLVCRTGPAESNLAIATAAQARGWKWNPYGSGFTNTTTGDRHLVTSEAEVFDFVGLPYLEPKSR